MPLELISIAVLVVIFVASALLKINMGAIALVATFLVGTLLAGEGIDDVLSGFPTDLFVILVGVTFLFAIAQNNGTIDWVVERAVFLTGGRTWALPWVMFTIAAALGAAGAVPPAAVAIIAPTALSLARRNGISPLFMGLMIANGVSAGEFSPIGVFGIIVNGLADQAGLAYSPGLLFLSTFTFNLLLCLVLHLWFTRRNAPKVDVVDTTSIPASRADLPATTVAVVLTLCAILGMVASVLFFAVNIGFAALTAAVVVSIVSPRAGKAAVPMIAWPTVFLITGIVTYVGLLERVGAIDYLGNAVGSVGAPLLAALLICLLGGVVSAFASTTGILGALVPLAVPFMLAGDVNSVTMLIALSIASSVVDASPFSTTGALIIANVPAEHRDRLFSQLLRWGLSMIVVAPVLAWTIFVLPGW
ncbi:SLC13 family permease [Herbiconiux moechotypicola]|uniref:SLC13 family permease n=1 Tax=Herbiconiux moechotypicola TaxID=637393 RepID=A0ABN3E1V4_9MICO|nr:SLC13 family permease [Herbiconiux moechotypicola]MCS5731356.1 SLC13 family permease [Herbiconiux moechotypicola]